MGRSPGPVDWSWPWGEVLALLDDFVPDVRLINLETTITADGEFARRKPVWYRMHPDNVPALRVFRPDVCALANNHILDCGYQGLTDTVTALRRGSRALERVPTSPRRAGLRWSRLTVSIGC